MREHAELLCVAFVFILISSPLLLKIIIDIYETIEDYFERPKPKPDHRTTKFNKKDL